MREPRQLLAELVAIPSVNPMGQPSAGTECFEARLSQFLLDLFRENGIAAEAREVVPGRSNVLACLPGDSKLPTVLWDAHQDTVPGDTMTVPAFSPTIDGQRMFGRGTCDVKGGMAAMLCAMMRAAKDPVKHRPSLIMACTCDEEFDELGVTRLIEDFRGRQFGIGSCSNRAPDLAIVAEPTELHVAVAHRGATRWKLRTKGVATHSSDPSQGCNAIYAMAHVLVALEEYAAQLAKRPAHPLCGPRTLSVGRIQGGTSVNIVPAECSIEIDRRILPGEDGLAVIDELERFLHDRLEVDFQMLEPWTVGVSLADDDNGDLSRRLVTVAQTTRASCRRVGVPFGTHAARYAQAGVPSVVFGPGSVAQAHTDTEWLDLDELDAASDILLAFLRSWR